MRITYDPIADAMYLYFIKNKKSTHTEEVGDGLIIDFNRGKIIGIEILDVSKKLPKKELDEMTFSIPIYSSKQVTVNK